MKRKLSAIAAALIVVAMLVTGTFAWVNFQQNITNEWSDEGTPGGTTHDDFCKPKKEVYVENWGRITLFVRIRLDEYMEIGEGAALKGSLTARNPNNKSTSVLPGANIDVKTTWKPHMPVVGDATVCHPTPLNTGMTHDFHYYWKWTMGGQKYYRSVLNYTNERYKALDYVDVDTADYPTGTGAFIKQTLPATVMTMAQWKAAGHQIGNFWVIDTDGWCYWAAPLAPGTATGLLLSKVDFQDNLDDSYYYAINVLSQMATKNGDQNYKDFYNNMDSDHTATENGKDLLEIITGNKTGDGSTVPATGIAIGLPNPRNMTFNETANLSYTLTPSNSTDIPTWSSSDETVATVNSLGVVTAKSKVGTTTITATARAGVSNSITVNVSSGTDPDIPRKNGEGPYDTKWSDVAESNYSLTCFIIGGQVNHNYPNLEQDGSIKLSDILDSSFNTTGLSVRAVDSKYNGFFSIGTDKDGAPAIKYTYIPEISVWTAAVDTTKTPVIEGVELILSKNGYQDTRIKVTLRYHGSLFVN
jgi:hypothetical protein